MILFGPIRREFRESDILKSTMNNLRSCCCVKVRKDGDDETSDHDDDKTTFMNQNSNSGNRRKTSGTADESGFSTLESR